MVFEVAGNKIHITASRNGSINSSTMAWKFNPKFAWNQY